MTRLALEARRVCVIPSRTSGRDLICTDGRTLHELPRSAERHRETSNQNKSEISHEVNVVRIGDERDRDAEFDSIGQQADHEHKNVLRTPMTQMQMESVVQTEDRDDSRTDADVVMARNKG